MGRQQISRIDNESHLYIIHQALRTIRKQKGQNIVSKKIQAAIDARTLMLTELRGVLSTNALNMPGYPFGSVLPFCLDDNGWPVIQVARISQHTRNMDKDSKVSLIICEPGLDDVLTGKRLTVVGNAEKISDNNEVAQIYYSLFPQGRIYQNAHESDFYRIVPVRSRYIGGFAQAFWFDNEALFKANPFFGEAGLSVINHMNDDHQNALLTYCQHQNIAVPNETHPVMVSVDGEGMHLRMGAEVIRIPFADAVSDSSGLRQTLVAMAKKG